jgi:hypothetical protein
MSKQIAQLIELQDESANAENVFCVIALILDRHLAARVDSILILTRKPS